MFAIDVAISATRVLRPAVSESDFVVPLRTVSLENTAKDPLGTLLARDL